MPVPVPSPAGARAGWGGRGLPFHLHCRTEKPCGVLSRAEWAVRRPSEASDKRMFAFCKMHFAFGARGGGGCPFFLFEFPAAATRPVCTHSPAAAPHQPLSRAKAPFGGGGAFRCLCSPSRCRHQPSNCMVPLTHHGPASTGEPCSELLISVHPLPREAFALKEISINKPTYALFVLCLGFVWRWESSAGRRPSAGFLQAVCPVPLLTWERAPAQSFSSTSKRPPRYLAFDLVGGFILFYFIFCMQEASGLSVKWAGCVESRHGLARGCRAKAPRVPQQVFGSDQSQVPGWEIPL